MSKIFNRKRIKVLSSKVRNILGKDFQDLKIFCIGVNKTGTTSLELSLKQLGYKLGDQRQGELLVEEWAKRNFKPIIDLARTADAFQDIPFSLPYTYQALDQNFPNAKFILSVRDSADQWLSSMIRFHSKLWADGVRVPTEEDLKNANYIYKGYPYRTRQLISDCPKGDPYNKECMMDRYNRHNKNVCDYFRHRSDKLIVVNVSKSDDYLRMCEFLGKSPVSNEFPWLNSST